MCQLTSDDQPDRETIRTEVEKALRASGSAVARFLLSALGSSIPIVGGALDAATGVWGEREQGRINQLLNMWLKMQEEELREIGATLIEVVLRLDAQDEEIRRRIESPEYLALVRKAFRDWSAAESEEKRRLVRNLLANAAATRVTTDDVLKLFIQWIADYSEAHFKIIRIVHQHSGWTRAQIWREFHGEAVREDSAEADLFKLIFHDLSVGHVIRQEREVDAGGRFIRTQARRQARRQPYITTAFEDQKPYVLTELGRQFVHYTMNEIVPRIASGPGGANG